MFVVMALITTFLTTPLTVSLYPNWYQVKVERWRRGEIDWNGNPVERDDHSDSVAAAKGQLKPVPVRKLLVYLRLDGLSGICTLAALLSPNRGDTLSTPLVHPAKAPKQTEPQSEQAVEDAVAPDGDEETALKVHGIRLMELTDRDSSVMKVSVQDHGLWDPVINTFRAFGEWHELSLMAGVTVVPEHSYADTVIHMASQDVATDLLLLPWSETGTLADRQNGLEVDNAGRFANGGYAGFVTDVLDRLPGHVGVLVDHRPATATKERPPNRRSPSGLSIQESLWVSPSAPAGSRSHHLIFPFFGGEDDRFALRLVLQLLQNDHVTASVIQVPRLQSDSAKAAASTTVPPPRAAASGHLSDIVFLETLRDSISDDLQERVLFSQHPVEDTISEPAQIAVAIVRKELKQTSGKPSSIVVLGRHSSSVEPSSDIGSVEGGIGTETRRALGSVGSAMVQPENKVFASVLVLQASNPA